MPASKQTYREQTDAKRIDQIRAITRELPPACGDFLATIAVTTGTLTRLAYAIDLRTFYHFLQAERFAFADKPLYAFTDDDLARLQLSDLTAYVEYLTLYYKETDTEGELQPITNHERAIKRKLCTLRSFYDYLFKANRIPSNVTERLSLPRIHEKPIIRLTREEMSRMLDVAETGERMTKRQQAYHALTAKRDYAMLALFLGTGMRVSECVGINLNDLDLNENAVLVTRKGGNQAVLYFPQEVGDALADYLEVREGIEALPGHEEALFLSLQKRRMTQRAVEQLVKKYASVAAPLKTKISPHKLRSTYATNLYEATGDIYLVADALGHSSVETTKKHYAEMRESRRRMAATQVSLKAEPVTGVT